MGINKRKGISYKSQTTFVRITMSFKEKVVVLCREAWTMKSSQPRSLGRRTLSSDGLWWVTSRSPGDTPFGSLVTMHSLALRQLHAYCVQALPGCPWTRPERGPECAAGRGAQGPGNTGVLGTRRGERERAPWQKDGKPQAESLVRSCPAHCARPGPTV